MINSHHYPFEANSIYVIPLLKTLSWLTTSIRTNSPSESRSGTASVSPLMPLSPFTMLHPHWHFLCSLNTQVSFRLLSTGLGASSTWNSRAPDFYMGLSLPHQAFLHLSLLQSLLSGSLSWSGSLCVSTLPEYPFSLFPYFRICCRVALPIRTFYFCLLSHPSLPSTAHTHSPEYRLSELRDLVFSTSIRAGDRYKPNKVQT